MVSYRPIQAGLSLGLSLGVSLGVLVGGPTAAPAHAAGASSAAAPTTRELPAPTLRAAFARSEVPVGSGVALSGSVTPVATSGTTIHLQRLEPRGWVTVGSRLLRTTGRFSFTVARPERGRYTYRVLAPARRGYRATTVTVRVAFLTPLTYSVVTRGRTTTDPVNFATHVARTYADPRGWRAALRHFARVPSGGDFTVVLAEPAAVAAFSPECSATYSCRVGRYVIINEDRWRLGTPDFLASGGTLDTYRQMVVNHETGHWLGRGHGFCGGPGQLAPVMQQQSKGMAGCRPNPWPLPAELAALR